MLNFKTVFVLAFLTTATNVSADEVLIDTTDLHATITAQLAEGMEQMQKNLTEDLNTVLIAEETTSETDVKVTLAD
ncbi:hypothetical protein FM038_018170 [Shewanella eurypsychrophilus]|uniref:Uncharacterized protein n=1 Tax=Shewanella eurypsychrophilus TaxID=2593656 RepID=A0ABX6V8Y1_9GAMM|nr:MULTISPECIES: hypothetical protein [Shewanella]QFU23894.1 hypothetical protein FS418_19945 [Shewanella sp. YLB-09]QPG59115.1 hypothetical protein FM038_018170 [Shewanella eurypsychrophilus]